MGTRLTLALFGAILLVAPLASPPALARSPLSATSLLVREADARMRFDGTLAPEMALEPALAKMAIAAMASRREAARSAAAGDEAEAVKAGYPYRRHAHEERWTAEAETPALLAFSGAFWAYTGGAHGNYDFAALLWDRARGRVIRLADLFTDAPRALGILEPVWCEALAAEQRRRRGGDTPPNDLFARCPKLGDMVIVPVGSRELHSLKVMVPPYVAGPYVEGSYILTLSIEPVRALLQPRLAGPVAKP